ncbi:hypothetical protein F5Y10DRAFT_289807 [Nemania abortiva]|nr:hypothetical protein F5Y10DRAFT_289807 [Nemania abortiva]
MQSTGIQDTAGHSTDHTPETECWEMPSEQNHNSINVGPSSSPSANKVDDSIPTKSEQIQQIPRPHGSLNSLQDNMIEPPRPLETAFDAADSVIPTQDMLPERGIDSVDGSLAEHTQDSIPSDNICKRMPLRRSLGISGIVTLVGGFIVSLVVTGFLIFLWAGEGHIPGGAAAPRLWRYIMLHSWAIQAVTLTSVVLRVLVVAQASLCSSMVAALLFETTKVPLSLSAHLSLTRGINTGPRKLIQTLILAHEMPVILKLETVLLTVILFASLGTQFSSTILLSDFNTTRLVGYPETLQLNVSSSLERTQELLEDRLGFEGILFAFLRPTFPTVGKLVVSDATVSNASGISDSGLIRQAFLPFGQEDREKSNLYEGPAIVADTRVSCIRPSISHGILGPTMLYEDDWFVNITISYEESYREAGLDLFSTCRDPSRNESCMSPVSASTALLVPPKWQPGDPKWTAGAHFMWANDTQFEHSWDIHQTPLNLSSGSTPFLVFTTNIFGNITEESDHKEGFELIQQSSISYGEWTTYEILPSMFLNVSLCFVGLHASMSQVLMERNTDVQEPNVIGTLFQTAQVDNIEEALSFSGLGNLSQNSDKKNIFSIARVEEFATSLDSDVKQGFSAAQMSAFLDLLVHLKLNDFVRDDVSSIELCLNCYGSYEPAPYDLASILTHIIINGGQLATAFQFFIMVTFQRSYYYYLPGFDAAASARVAFSNYYDIPRRWGGLSIVLSLVFVQGLCVYIISGLFVTRVRYTMQSNVWHTISQLASPDLEPILQQSNQAKDDEIEKLLRGQRTRATLRRSSEDGNVILMKREDKKVSDAAPGLMVD